MASSNVWSDFDALRHNVKSNTVERLKQILTGFNEECFANCTKSGKKQDLIDRITNEMEAWRANNSVDKWVKGRAIINQVRSTGCYTPQRSAEHSYPAPPSGHAYPVGANHSSYPSGTSSSGTIPRYDPYAPPRRPNVPPASSAATAAVAPPGIHFSPSPFFKVQRSVSSIVECPESTSSMDRRQQSLSFTINNDVLTKLNSTSPKYQLRLYCTSSTYYSSSSFRPHSSACPIEFPPTCEVRVNGVALSANLKGMKKKPGTAPPPDIMKNLRMQNGASNRIEMVYVNSQQQPVQSKKYYLVVMLVETTTVEQLIDRLKKGKYKSGQEILAQMNQAASEDDDIVAGHQKMSLKCPLSYMRIATPCRSTKCVHSQCFDAFSWYSVMEQTTTWLCPVCEKALNMDDLIVDGYFDEILRSTHEDLEDVIVEADGQWHSEDNKYGSAQWKATHPETKPAQVAQAAQPAAPRSPPKSSASGVNGHGQPPPSDAEIVILDSDDEDEGRVKRELSPSNELHAASSKAVPPPVKTHTTADVIDLTLDSDDEDLPAPPSKKRKATDEIASPTEQIWKKSRSEASSPPSVTSGSSTASWSYQQASLPPRPVANGSSTTARYTSSSYAPATQYPGYHAPPPVSPGARRPPPANQYSPRSPDWRR
ncbi:PINIT domain-containing protein [Rhodofomes roseus]|uniref:PINIT domain-containing protein n=1 Tax=Rhodofomes roseus TaxID=34475 RepID=A0ABQ8KHC0_9APHY|nr:PINIT domain-containing protein [Rhodofomes roseus]KAH9837202.1 PINIT domain-containing protein [Rhodofomes roseus]